MTANRPGDFSPASGAHSGLFTSSSAATTALPTDSSDVIIWDRVPAQDLKEMELPSKVCVDPFSLNCAPIAIGNDVLTLGRVCVGCVFCRWNGLLVQKAP